MVLEEDDQAAGLTAQLKAERYLRHRGCANRVDETLAMGHTDPYAFTYSREVSFCMPCSSVTGRDRCTMALIPLQHDRRPDMSAANWRQ